MARKTKMSGGGTATAEPPTGGDAAGSTLAVGPVHAELIDVERIQVRNKHDRDLKCEPERSAVASLAESMRSRGLLQPIKVVLDDAKGLRYDLVYGERRLAAARLLGWEQIPAIIGDRATLEVDRVIENAQREDPNPIQQAVAVADAFAANFRAAEVVKGFNVDAGEEPVHPADIKAVRTLAAQMTAKALGKPVQWVYDRLFLGDLDSKTRLLVVQGKLPMEHARELAAVADPETRAEMAERFAGDPAREVEPTRLSEVRMQVGKVVRLLSKVPWDLSIPFANAPACDRCPKNSRNIAGLFEGKVTVGERWHTKQVEAPEEGVCTDQACFGRKQGTVNRQIATAAQRLVKAELTVSAKGKEAKEAAVSKGSIEVPAHAKADSFKREARARAKDKLGQTPAASGSSGSKPAKRAETAEKVAARKLAEAREKWRTEVGKSLNKLLKGDHHRIKMVNLLLEAKVFDDAEVSTSYRTVPEPTPAKLKACEAAIDLLKLPAAEAWLKIASLVPGYEGSVYLPTISTELLEKLATAIGLDKLPPKPEPARADAKPVKGKKPKGGKPAKPAPEESEDVDADEPGDE